MSRTPTIGDVLEAINNFAGDTEHRFGNMDERFAKIDERFANIDERFDRIEAKMTTFVTMDYLDRKFADFKGEMVVLMKKLDGKTDHLIDILEHKEVLTKNESLDIRVSGPFPNAAFLKPKPR
ncbi:MAG: hypothetical protein AAB692_05960, partial [Patescibacteria group bacterium]